MYETWYCYSPAKSNTVDAAALFNKGVPSNGAAEAEFNFYNWTNKVLALAGVQIELETQPTDYLGIKIAFGPKILMDPTFAITFQEIKSKFAGTNKISKDATLVLADKDLFFENLDLGSGSLVCKDGVKIPGKSIEFEFSN